MSIERIKVTNNQIITKDANGNETFSTDNKYVKTDTSATFKAGGNQRCAVICGETPQSGSSSISDHTEYGIGNFLLYPQIGVPQINNYNAQVQSDSIGRYLSLAVPSFDTFYWYYANINKAAWDYYYANNFTPGVNPGGYIISAPTNYLYNGNIGTGTYRLISYRPYLDFGKSGGYQWIGYVVSDFNPSPLERAAGGIFTFDREIQGYDSITGAPRNIVSEWINDYATYSPGTYPPPQNWDFLVAVTASKTPVNLNLGITP